jgi:hypothetical protein
MSTHTPPWLDTDTTPPDIARCPAGQTAAVVSKPPGGIATATSTGVIPPTVTTGRASAWSALPLAAPASDCADAAVSLAEVAVVRAVAAVRFAALAVRLPFLAVFSAFLAVFATEPIDGPPNAGETMDTASRDAQARTAAIAVLLMG